MILAGAGGLSASGATIHWSDPVTIAGPEDVHTLWTLERAYSLGADRETTVQGVTFLPFRAPSFQPDTPLPGSIRDDKTEVAVSGDQDGLFAGQGYCDAGVTAVPADYRQLLAGALTDQGSAFALTFHGLTVGTTYLVQLWVNDSRNCSLTEIATGGAGNSPPIKFNRLTSSGGLGQHITGVFTADATRQTITFSPTEGGVQLNALQLRAAPANVGLGIARQPLSQSGYAGNRIRLSVLVAGTMPATYQWQRITEGRVRNIYDDGRYSGATADSLTIQDLDVAKAGDYRVEIRDATGVVTSRVATVSLLLPPARPLINVDINNGASTTFAGDGLLVGNSGFDVWNGLDGAAGFTNAALVDSTGAETPVTLTLVKPVRDGFTSDLTQDNLLKDYSPSRDQTVRLEHLAPEAFYSLVVYSIGKSPYEGGVFSGAINGVVYGGTDISDQWTRQYCPGTNYIQNPFVRTDTGGRLEFHIAPLASIITNGFFNGDFNGLQVARVAPEDLRPYILQAPRSGSVYRGQPLALAVDAVAPPGSSLTYQWQFVTATATNDVVDNDSIRGATGPRLTFTRFLATNAGDYRVVLQSASGATTSAVAQVDLLFSPRQINVDMKDSGTNGYTGAGVLQGLGGNYWNSINGRRSFAAVPLRDNNDQATAVTLSLLKEQVDSYTSPLTTNALLKEYSVGRPQTVILDHLEPGCHYHLVVYSMGAMANEGGVFSGAIQGVVWGWNGRPDDVAHRFVAGTNYLANPAAMTDASGRLSFTIEPTATVTTNGFYNSDFNGLQILRVE